MKRYLLLALVSLATAVDAAPTILLLDDRTDLPPPYSQQWTATPADFSWAGNASGGGMPQHEVFVRGDGKHGDFYGILYLDCAEPKYSRWMATGGFLTENDVPSAAIATLRAELC